MSGIKYNSMNLESKKSIINKSQKDFFEFLTNLKNFEQLMPENTDKFEVDGESFIFSLKGMPEIRLVVKEKQAFDKIVLGAASSKLNSIKHTNMAKNNIINKIEQNLGRKIKPTYLDEKKFNLFNIKLKGGW